jgi:hypothetical protein
MTDPDLLARAVAQIRKSTANYEYFFEHLSSPEWLEPLRDAGFFTSPPAPVREGDYISFPGWPESRCLARMAAIESAAPIVYSIAVKIPATENVRVFHDLAEVALALPPDLGARFVAAAKVWIASPYQLLIPDQLGKLVLRLAENGKVRAALDLAKSLLELVPDSRGEAGDGAETRGLRDVRARFDEWHYEKILKETVPALALAGGNQALSVLCDLLASALDRAESRRQPGNWDDYSFIWRPAIEDHPQNSGHSAKDALVTGVRDAAEQLVRRDVMVLTDVVAELEARRWTVFRRIALHLAANFPDSSGSLAEARLTDRRLFDDVAMRHEYFNLARASFAALPEASQAIVLSYIEQGPDMEAAARWLTDALRREPSEEELLRYRRTWQLKQLSALEHSLPQVWAVRYQQWSEEYGKPEHPEFAAYHRSGWVGARSPKSADELRAFKTKELIQYLNSWNPPEHWDGASREGLANEWQALIASDPAPFVADANQFKALRPIFVRAFVSALRTAAGQGVRFEWAPILELFAWVVQQEAGDRSEGSEFRAEDPDLSWTQRAIADFVSDSLAHEERSPPYSLRAEVWRVLYPLTNDPDPTPEDERRYGPPNMDPFTQSLNTTRGQALHGVMNFIHWSSRHSPVERPDDRRWVTKCSEAREVLERHLQPARDPSRAVRSVYGQWLPTLVYLDVEWVKTHLRAILPDGAAFQELRDAAWDAYVVFCNPQSKLLPLLRGEYEYAVHSISVRAGSRHGRDPVERLAEHLMVFYWWGDLDLAADGLVSGLFSAATDSLREHALDFIGRSLCEPETPPPEVLGRLQALWESRFEVAKSRPADHVEELSAIGWWFASGRFDEEWALRQLRAVVRLTRKIEPAHKVVERLADSADARPLDALQAFEEIVDADKQGWLVTLVREDAKRLMKSALSHAESHDRAVDVLHRLGARGYSEFRQLLPPITGGKGEA